MKNIFRGLLVILFLNTFLFSETRENILKYYQDNGLTFVRIQGVPDHKLGAMIIKEVYKRLNINVNIISMPGKRALKEAQKGEIIDGEVIRIMKIQALSPTLIRLSPHIRELEGTVFSIKHKVKIKEWSSLNGYKIGMVRGVQYIEDGLAKSVNKSTKISKVKSDESLLLLLNLGRVDLAVTAKFNGLYQIKKLKLSDKIHSLDNALTKERLYHYLNVKHKLLVPIIEDHLAKMKQSGELDKLRIKMENILLDKISGSLN
ncbi:MAG: transporter substrate-binding domain-containing protein [Campylobacteraceae bacterium]|nr:transporter substrate-binding domain-containing protein [Campylobacteraceae bacterium]